MGKAFLLGGLAVILLVFVSNVSSLDLKRLVPVDVSPVRPIRPICGPVCLIHCPFGNVPDAKGCPTCQCREKPVCRRLRCYRPCPHGNAKDAHGCQTCRCKDPPKPPLCNHLRLCKIHCPNGYVTNSYGCPTCKCKPVIKPPVCGPICRMYCPNGFVKGPDGCPICKCKPTNDCSPRRCLRYCRSGRRKPSGCTCSCNDRYRDRLPHLP